MESNEELFTKDKTSLSKKGSFVYGFIDLFSGYGETWSWGFGMDETAGKSSSLPLSNLDGSKQRFETHEKKFNSKETRLVMQEHPAKLDTVGEVIEDSKNSLSLTSSSTSSEEDFVVNDDEGEKEVIYDFVLISSTYCLFYLSLLFSFVSMSSTLIFWLGQ